MMKTETITVRNRTLSCTRITGKRNYNFCINDGIENQAGIVALSRIGASSIFDGRDANGNHNLEGYSANLDDKQSAGHSAIL
mgnify:CR=1 FL=1